MLDRDAGTFRLAAADIEVPAARRYLPGTSNVGTSWASSGWIIVRRDVLLIKAVAPRARALATHRRAPS